LLEIARIVCAACARPADVGRLAVPPATAARDARRGGSMRSEGAELIGTSVQMIELRHELDRIARSDAKVLITGESGVGKELVARAIHASSPRVDRPFVPVNCAGLPETLLESELFGHVKGSFTGAYRDKPGKLEAADQGTVFLDEVGEMTLRMQGLLLRFLETGELQKVGADRAGRTVDVRVIAATNRNLQDMIVQGVFREDLFYRLNVIHFWVPPLRERKDDIPLMIEHFLQRFTKGNGCVVRGFEGDALAALTEYHWPGNVRELENVIERLVVTSRHELVRLDELPPEVRAQRGVAVRPKRERRRTVADDLYKRLVEHRESFWTAVYPLYMQREITKQNVRDVVRKGLEEARGNYKIVCKLFNMESADYKKFLNFLRKHDCQLPFKEYRQ
jgi:transcriptional regulator with PAS, ATPase and Fis domain